MRTDPGSARHRVPGLTEHSTADAWPEESSTCERLDYGLLLRFTLLSSLGGFSRRVLGRFIYSVRAENSATFFATRINRAQVFSSLHLPNCGNHAVLLDCV